MYKSSLIMPRKRLLNWIMTDSYKIMNGMENPKKGLLLSFIYTIKN